MNACSASAGGERSTLLPQRQAGTTTIRPGEVHVWHGVLEAPSPDPVTLAEAARARGMRAERRRREFLVCRGALRRILAVVLGIDALAVPIIEGAHGKPRLERDGRDGRPPIGFNLSHSGGRFVVAIALDREPGVDIERVRPRRDLEGLARRFFSPAEQAEVGAAPDPLDAFYRLWTRKEAVIKADGRGVGIGLDRFDVSSREPPLLRDARWSGAVPGEASRWSLRSLDAGPGYVAALAIRSPAVQVIVWTPPPDG